jgi:hypothetical protein
LLVATSSRYLKWSSYRVIAIFFIKKRPVLTGIVAGYARWLEAHVLVLYNLLVVGAADLLYLKF